MTQVWWDLNKQYNFRDFLKFIFFYFHEMTGNDKVKISVLAVVLLTSILYYFVIVAVAD